MKPLRCEDCCGVMSEDGICYNCGAELDFSIKEHDNEGYLFYNDEDFEEAGFQVLEPEEREIEEFPDREPTREELDQLEKELQDE